MLDKFIDCIVSNDPEIIKSALLIKGGGISDVHIKAAWGKIKDEWTDGLRDPEQEAILLLFNEIKNLKFKVSMVHSCLYRLSVLHSDETKKELRGWISVTEALDPKDPERYVNDLDSILARTKEWEVEIRQMETEIGQRLPTEGQATQDRAHYEKMIAQVSRHVKFQLNKYTITAGQFMTMLADLIRASREAERQYNNL